MYAGFHVKYEVKPSPYGGVGLFAAEYIPANTLIWKYERGVNVRSYKNEAEILARLEELNADEQKYFMDHVYLFDGFMNEILDDGRLWNHSETPNTGTGSGCDVCWQSSYSIRDIQPGEELLDDYGCYEYPTYFIELAKKYAVPQDFITKKEFVKPGFHVKYEVKPSPFGGVGLFAAEYIPANALIWKFAKNLNVKTYVGEAECRKHLSTLPTKEEQYEWISHVYCFDGCVNEICDDAKLWNHSETPNTSSGYGGDWDSTYAARNIEPGEELLDSYSAYEYPPFYIALCKEYDVPLDFIDGAPKT